MKQANSYVWCNNVWLSKIIWIVDISKSAQKNKKRREKKKVNETTDLEVGKDKDEEPAPVVKELNPVELIKQKIEEAKLSKVSLTVSHHTHTYLCTYTE